MLTDPGAPCVRTVSVNDPAPAANVVKCAIGAVTVLELTSTFDPGTVCHAPFTSCRTPRVASLVPVGTLDGSYAMVSLAGAAKVSPSGPKSVTVPAMAFAASGYVVNERAVIPTV